jgi:hypothetical protein
MSRSSVKHFSLIMICSPSLWAGLLTSPLGLVQPAHRRLERSGDRPRTLGFPKRSYASSWFLASILIAVFLAPGCRHDEAATGSSLAPTDPEWADQAARESLTDGATPEKYNWYDSEEDDLRPIRLQDKRKWEPEEDERDWTWLQNLAYVLAWILLGVILCVVAYFLAYMYVKRSKRLARGGDTDEAANEKRRIAALPISGKKKEGPLLAAAEAYYEQGQYAEAIMYYFSYLLYEMDKKHLIRLLKGKTNGQYFRELNPRPEFQSIYEEAMYVFEDSYFGDHPPTRERFEECWNRREEFAALLDKEVKR